MAPATTLRFLPISRITRSVSVMRPAYGTRWSEGVVDTVHIGHITERRQRTIQFMCADPQRAGPVAEAWCADEGRFGPKVASGPTRPWRSGRDFGI